jgi:hypothetical protein
MTAPPMDSIAPAKPALGASIPPLSTLRLLLSEHQHRDASLVKDTVGHAAE